MIQVFCYTKRGGFSPAYYYPKTEEGRKKARIKRAELMVRYPDGLVIINEDN